MKSNNVKIIAEIGINHNGDLNIAKSLIDIAKLSGCDYVKFQKRNPDVCVPENQKMKIRSTPWGEITYIDYKRKIEFSKKEYDILSNHCKKRNIKWFASVWDNDSVDFMKNYSDTMKIPSALITNHDLCLYARENCDKLMFSTGMSTESEVLNIRKYNPDVVFHTNSTYPSPIDELNLNYIHHLREIFSNSTEIGYSGHEYGLITTFASVAMGAKWIERHITLDRNLWGSDQLSSIEPTGLFKLVKGIRDIESSLGTNGERILLNSELLKRKSLRGV